MNEVATDPRVSQASAREPASEAMSSAPPELQMLRGQVVEDTTGLLLSNVAVRWVLRGGSHGREGDAVVLGEARSDEDGSFAIAPADRPEVREALCRLAWNRDLRSSLVLPDFGDEAREFRIGPQGDEDATLVRVAGDADPGGEAWNELSAYLASNRMLRVDDLVRQLSTPFPDAPVRTWPVTRRAGALAAVGRVLANDGNADGTALLEQTHLLDLDALRGNDVAKAFTRFRDAGLFQRFGGNVSEWLKGSYFKLPKSDLALYRDYLRGVWVGAAKMMHTAKGQPTPSDAALETQLDTRFLQDFHTADASARPVHGLLIDILRDALTAGADRHGFGVAVAALPARGATESDIEYVARLIAVTGESAEELRNRYRVRLDRPPTEQASPVALNVEALLGLLADTWQSPQEPFPTALRGIEPGRPLLFPAFLGRGPFFLQFEEWLDRQRRFFPENVFDIRRTIPVFHKGYRDVVAGQKTAGHPKLNPNNDFIVSEPDWHASASWMERVFALTDEIRAALGEAEKQAYAEAHRRLDAAVAQIQEARQKAPSAWMRGDFVWYNEDGSLPSPDRLKKDRRVSLKTRAARPVTTRAELAEFEAYFDTRPEPRVAAYENGPSPGFYDWMESWLARARTLHLNQLDYLELVLVPYLRSTIFTRLGEHAGAVKLLGRITGYEVGIAEVTDVPGYVPTSPYQPPYFHQRDSLPYTTAVAFDAETGHYTDQSPHKGLWAGARSPQAPPLIAPFEHRFFKLAQGEAMLAWADDLYRNDDPSSIRRARELYKGVIFMHGEDPGIAPNFALPGWQGLGGTGGLGIAGIGNPVASQANPARTSQLARARAGFGQIELGLNAYGFRDDMVPVLRYKPLKLAADLFAASAKSAQADFLQYQSRFEQATIEGWQTAAIVKKAEAGAGIAAEQIEIAKAGVAKAQEQVAAVKAQIEAKKKEIEDADSFFSQAEAFFGGMKDSLSGLASAAKGVMTDSSAAGSVSGEQLLGMLGKSAGGASAAKEAMVATLGSGAALTLGFGAFAYYGYTSMEGMAEAAAKRTGDLQALVNVALPAAQAQVTLKERDVTIARFGQQIATAELDLARALDRFQRERFLNVGLWNQLAASAQRTMRRYVELGARAAWLAERALAFECNRPIDVIRLNYVPTAARGLTGADRLLLDLAELEANRLNGIRLTAPVKHTMSLARDFPLAFGRLKQTGRCSFHTRESTFQSAYPGTYAYRLRAVTVAAHDADGPPPRGMLRNLGASTVSREGGGTPKLLVRFPDALPLSEFRLHQDLWVYGLPGETLLQFEGGGIETDWEIEFPVGANPKGLRSLADVMITFDMQAMYSQALATQIAAAPPAAVARALALAASVWDPAGLASLRDEAEPARIRFDLTRLALPAGETNRKITNLALLAVGKTTQSYAATIEAEGEGAQAAFSIDNGLALSNAGPLLGAAAALPLNAMTGRSVGQAFVVEVDRAGVQAELEALQDVVLWLEYSAQP